MIPAPGPRLGERLLPGPVERVWAYLTESKKRATWLAVGGGWATHTGILADQLNGVKPRPFWTTHAREMKAFEAAL